MTKTKAGPISAERLKSFIERIENLREEKKAITSDERDVFAEAHGVGYDKKAMREVLKRRAMDSADRDEWDNLIDTYEHALGARGVAAREVAAGATYEEAAKAANVSRATVARSVASLKNLERETVGEVERAAGIEPVVSGLEDHSSTIELRPHADAPSTPQPLMKPEIGAVAPSSARVATINPDTDDLAIPNFLRRTERVRA